MNAKVCFGAWTFGVATWLSAWPSCFRQIILLKVRKCLRVFSDWLVLCATVEGGREGLVFSGGKRHFLWRPA